MWTESSLVRGVLDSLRDGVFFVNLEGRITYWNEAAELITGISAKDAIGELCREKLLHVDENGADVPVGEPGEVICRGDIVMAGYWNNPEATASSIRDGWLWTGDIGAFDEDGFLSLKDHSKDVIISGGTNIYPREVEEVLLRHPGVLECAVIGRPHKDWGEEVVAFVRPRPGERVETEELDRLCLENIARFKRPKEYRMVPDLPKNNYGKILKTELRRMADTADVEKSDGG